MTVLDQKCPWARLTAAMQGWVQCETVCISRISLGAPEAPLKPPRRRWIRQPAQKAAKTQRTPLPGLWALQMLLHGEAVPVLLTAPCALPGAGPVAACAWLSPAAESGTRVPAGHGLRGGTGQRRVGRPRGAKAIVLDWRILTKMAREKQIGREMNKLY